MPTDKNVHLMDQMTAASLKVLYMVSTGKPEYNHDYGDMIQEVNVFAKPTFPSTGSFGNRALFSMFTQSHNTIRQLDASKCTDLDPSETVEELKSQLSYITQQDTTSTGHGGPDHSQSFPSEILDPSEYHERRPKTDVDNVVMDGEVPCHMLDTLEGCTQRPGLTVRFRREKWVGHDSNLDNQGELLVYFATGAGIAMVGGHWSKQTSEEVDLGSDFSDGSPTVGARTAYRWDQTTIEPHVEHDDSDRASFRGRRRKRRSNY
ncbi:hypothetical protein IAT40_005160 [Kwoniella sp. CBS 6097]